ncbi:MAG: IS1595 family transposase [Patescibacteria group bacterium]
MNKYTISQFRREFNSENVCLEYVFNKRFKDIKGFYRVKGRKCWANAKGEQIHPLAGTIFEKSSTSLQNWFYAIFLFAASRNGVSAKELQRQLGVTYKCAWRMAYQIRELMTQDGDPLEGTVEVDETYIGGRVRGNNKKKFDNKTPVMGMVERGGKVKAFKIPNTTSKILLGKIRKNIKQGSKIMSDELWTYHNTWGMGYSHYSIMHSAKEYVRGSAHTNTIEGFWSQFKRSVSGTYHSVSKKHLQSYVNEFSFRYNHRALPIFGALMARI